MQRHGIPCPECQTAFGAWISPDGTVETQGCSYVAVSGSHRPLTADEIVKQIEAVVGPGPDGGYHLSPTSLKLNPTR